MSADPTSRNRLAGAASPYLRQHADNPVNWQPWDEHAREAARERDDPIFLSIGYAACHWCHVMEEESFQDDTVASLLNEHFVPIKVDREERPDVDSIYMSICQQVTGRGGWPLNAWLTPDGQPFYVGTYFPKEPKRGAPGFVQLLRDIAESWNDPEQREDMQARARQWTEAIESDVDATPAQSSGSVSSDTLETAASAAVRGADREHGGWGRGQKFPQPARVRVLMRAAADRDSDTFADVVRETLDAMADGGLQDQLGGGFHRYTVDREWVVPHFEKMLYDNAELARLYLTGAQFTGEERYRDVARRTLSFVERELTHPEGGFYSTLDAESERPDGDGGAGEREEGAYYVWTRAAVRDAIEAYGEEIEDVSRATDLFCDRFGVTPSGNFEGETVLTVQASTETLAERYDLDEAAVDRILERTRLATMAARDQRPRPPRDEKILAGWNGLMISAFATAAVVDDPRWASPAIDALSFVSEHLWDADTGRLSRRYRDDDAGIDGYLEDYAFLARAALNGYEVTGDPEHLRFALALAEAIVESFWDEDAETLYFTPQDGEALVARPQELADQSTPSRTGVATETLLALSHFTPTDRFAEVAASVLQTHQDRMASDPLQHPSLVLAADTHTQGCSELTLALSLEASENAHEQTDEVALARLPADWRTRLRDTYLPRGLLAPRPGTDAALGPWLDRLELEDAPPIWANRTARDGESTIYACRDRTCSPPAHDIDEAMSWFTE